LSVFFDNSYRSGCIFVIYLSRKDNREIAEYFGVLGKFMHKKSTIYFLRMNAVSVKGGME
ncbi:MAG: hypothetical protein ACYT04_92735, partial [Nostoc sp.]